MQSPESLTNMFTNLQSKSIGSDFWLQQLVSRLMADAWYIWVSVACMGCDLWDSDNKMMHVESSHVCDLGVQDGRTVNSYIDRWGPAVWDWSLPVQCSPWSKGIPFCIKWIGVLPNYGFVYSLFVRGITVRLEWLKKNIFFFFFGEGFGLCSLYLDIPCCGSGWSVEELSDFVWGYNEGLISIHNLWWEFGVISESIKFRIFAKLDPKDCLQSGGLLKYLVREVIHYLNILT